MREGFSGPGRIGGVVIHPQAHIHTHSHTHTLIHASVHAHTHEHIRTQACIRIQRTDEFSPGG